MMVVSDINDKLSPKNEPPTMTAVSIGIDIPVSFATPAAIGARATIVPTLVPIDNEIKHEATNNPAVSNSEGNK